MTDFLRFLPLITFFIIGLYFWYDAHKQLTKNGRDS